MDIEYYQDEFKKERRARLAAERLLEQKQSQLKAANKKLSQHAIGLSGQIVDQRKVLDKLQDENSDAVAKSLKANHKALAAERLLWDAVKSIQDGFALFDKDRKLIAANSPYLALFQSAKNIGPGISIESILDLCLEDDLIDRGGKSEDAWYDFMLDRLVKDDIKPIILKLHNGVYIKLVDRRTADGGIVSLALNITDTIAHENALLKARDTAQAADRAKSDFLAKMSHEFRTPINGVVGMADLLLERATDEDTLLYAETIKTSGQSLLDFVNNVLEYAVMDSGRLTLNAEAFDYRSMIDSIGSSISPNDIPDGLEIAFETDTQLPSDLIGDASRIGQIIHNLYSNAMKNTQTGSVMVRSIWRDNKLIVAVEDTGTGIPEDKLDLIFAGFAQTNDSHSRDQDGAGLGLSIVQKLVDAMGGELNVVSIAGEGSHFEVSIPMPAGPGSEVSSTPRTDIGSVLLVSENPLTRAALIRACEMCHVDFEEAERIPTRIPESVTFAIVDQALVAEAQNGLTDLRIISIGYDEGSIALPYHATDLLAALGNDRVETRQETSSEKLRVLAAEDNKTNTLVFQKMLKDVDIDLKFATNGIEAVTEFKSFQPHLIFMDISMPRMDGMEATQQIRWHEVENGLDAVPIVAMTAHAMEGDEARIRNCGLDHYMTKPLSKPAIVEMINSVSAEIGLPSVEQKAS